MKPSRLNSIHYWHLFCLLLITGAFLGSTSRLSAAAGRKLLQLEVSADQRSAKVKVPKGVANVTIQMFDTQGGWCKVIDAKAASGVMKFKLPVIGSKRPALAKNLRWRALGLYDLADMPHDKFPASFYKGAKKFGSVKLAAGSQNSRLGTDITSRAMTDMATDSSPTTTGSTTPEESDIWKIDGNTVYFFNQLRGLQVLDMSNPSDPHLTASLRLPAMGQDLFLLPASAGDARTVVLLTQGWADSGQWTRINLVKVSGGKAEITYTQDVPGDMSDSRLAGNRLILATTEWNYSDVGSANGWSSRSRLSEWLLDSNKAPVAAGETVIEGYNPLIASGPDWLALAVQPTDNWNVSDVSVFAVSPSGLIPMGSPTRTEGSIASKFGIQWRDNVLTTISESNPIETTWSPVTVLENFRALAPGVMSPNTPDNHLGRLELANGESLFATRIAGDKAYVVTYQQTDPLWVVDLADPQNPVIAGQIEVPGWSTHLEPIGDMLFAIGWDSNTVAASLFDVADAANPKLLRRVDLGAPGSYSEALWDEKALKVLPNAGLAMVPLTNYDSATGATSSVVQLLDIDLVARDLRLRGKIAHEFDARRADLIGNTVVSISQRVLVDADITDRDSPVVLSEVSLAWPVDRVLAANGYMYQIENGSWYGGSRATVRVSPENASEEILSEIDLGDGTVKAADYRDGKLYILRQSGPGQSSYYWRPILATTGENKITLDIYDTSAAPALTLLGSCSLNPASDGQISGDGLLWPKPNRPSLVLDYHHSYWFRFGGPIMMEPLKTLASVASRVMSVSSIIVDPQPTVAPEKGPRLVLFDTSDPKSPEVADPVLLGPAGTTLTGAKEASDGLIVLGTSQWKDKTSDTWVDYGKAYQFANVIEVLSSGTPIVRTPISLPGELFAVTELNADGFLAFTRTSNDDQSTTLQVSASDGVEAFLIDGITEPAYSVVAAGGRRLYVAKGNGVERHLLGDEGVFVSESTLEIGWTPYSLRWLDGTLIGSNWNSLFAVDANSDKVAQWNFQSWYLSTERVTLATNGDLLVPFADYGTERLPR